MNPAVPRARRTGLQAKVAFLSRPASYPEKPAAVEVIETHMSCVFLTDRYAYKLKKPVHHEFLDFRTIEARRRNCEEELRLNRRLAGDVYLDVVPLARAKRGQLVLGAGVEVVDWLVRMRRLPAGRMLDRAIRDGSVRRPDVRRFALTLANFYRSCKPVSMTPEHYQRRFRQGIRAARRALTVPAYHLDPLLVRAAATALVDALDRHPLMFDRRVVARKIVEGHGDLRPEHVCLEAAPLFIDCLEFNADLRTLDPADELAYLALECEYAGAAWVGELALDTYRKAAGDRPPSRLLSFYKGYRAAVRARLSARHLDDPMDAAARGKWIARAGRYLELSVHHARTASCAGR